MLIPADPARYRSRANSTKQRCKASANHAASEVIDRLNFARQIARSGGPLMQSLGDEKLIGGDRHRADFS
jgi:hypothetical protein